jgi:hypothetical protein
MKKNRHTVHVRNEGLRRNKEEKNILQTIKRRMAECIGHILFRVRFLKEGKIKERIE